MWTCEEASIATLRLACNVDRHEGRYGGDPLESDAKPNAVNRDDAEYTREPPDIDYQQVSRAVHGSDE